jgi:tetratricopeptide (TPR) repeat protein
MSSSSSSRRVSAPSRGLTPLRVLWTALLIGASLGLSAGEARADEVILRSGRVIRGEVLPTESETAPVRIRVKRGQKSAVVELERAEVRYIRRLGSDAERVLRQVDEALAAGEAGRAAKILTEYLEKNPHDARAYRELGFALLLANKPAPAVEALEEACRRDAQDLESRLSLASAQQQVGRRDAAIESYRQAATLAPKHARTWLRLADLLLRRWQARLKAIENLPPLPQGVAEGAKGDRAQELKSAQADRKEALEAFEHAKRADPRDEEVVLTHARVILEGPEGEDLAREVLARFLRRVPQAAGAARLLAQLEAASGNPRQALLRVIELLKRRDLLPELREHLEAEAALYAWLKDGAKTPAPPGTDAGADGVDLDRARLRLILLLDLLPSEPRLLLALARVELRAGDLAEARSWLDRVSLALGPQAKGSAADQAQADRVRADAAILARVSATLLKAKIVPGVSPPKAFFGPKVALAQAARTAQLVPWLPAAHRTHAAALERAGQFQEAAKAYARGAQRASGKARDELTSAAQAALEKARRKREHKDL